MSGDIQQADGLLYQAGAKRDYTRTVGDTEHWILPPDFHVAGDVTGSQDLAISLMQGRLAGLRGRDNVWALHRQNCKPR